MIVKNRLLNFKDKIIYQDDESFLFSLDSVLLANFVSIRLTDKNIIDLCSGNAPVAMLLSYRTSAKIVGVELQKEIYDIGVKSIIENNMEKQISFVNADAKSLLKAASGSYDVLVCNPPYFKYNEGSLINKNDKKSIARHEIFINLETIVQVAGHLLKNNGTFAIVHRPERFMEILMIMKKYNIEPKKIRFVYPKSDCDANMLLVEGKKNGKSGLKILPPLIIYDNCGNYNMEVKAMFGDDNNVAV